MSNQRIDPVLFTQISDAALKDKRLSFKARGILAVVLCQGSDWDGTDQSLQGLSDSDGLSSVRSGLDELLMLGYRIESEESVVTWKHVGEKPAAPTKTNRSLENEWKDKYGMQVFDQWWDKYPRKTSKPTAKKAYRKALDKTDGAKLLAAAIAYRDDPNRVQAFTKHPATWLNQECWNDDPLPPRPDSYSSKKMQRTSDILEWARTQDDHQQELGQ